MMSKMRKMIAALTAVAALAVPQLAAQQSAAMKNVDTDGFTLTVTDTGYIARWFEDVYHAGTAKLTADPDFSIIDKIVREIWNENKMSQVGNTAISAKETAPDFYTVKSFVEMSAEKRTGPLWKIFTGSNQALDFIDVMPKHTLVSFGCDLNGAVLFATVARYISKFGNQEVKNGFAKFLAKGMQNGADVRKLASSVEGVAFCLEADPARLVQPGYSSATLYLAVKDKSIMDAIVQAAKKNEPEIVTANNELMIPTPVGVIAVFQQGKYLVATTDFDGVKKLIAGTAPSLKQNPDYIKYAAATPAKGCAFGFVSSELGKSVIPAYLPMILADVTQYVDAQALLCKTIGIGSAVYGVSYAKRNGLGSVFNTGSKGIAILCGSPSANANAYFAFFAAVGAIQDMKNKAVMAEPEVEEYEFEEDSDSDGE